MTWLKKGKSCGPQKQFDRMMVNLHVYNRLPLISQEANHDEAS